MAIFRVDENGITVPSLEEAREGITSTFQQLFGDDLALDAQTPQGQLVGAIAVLEVVIGEVLTNLGNATDADLAVGTQQDALGTLLGILRRQATRSIVTATLTGVAGTGVLAGSRARTTGGAEFRTLADISLAPSPGVTVGMEAVEEGPVEAAAGTLTGIVTVIAGWETVTNAEDAVVGVARQDNVSYRQTYTARTGRLSQGPLAAIEAPIVEALATRRNVLENRDDAATTIQEWTLRPHAVLAVVEGGNDTAITRAIENSRGLGAPTMSAIRGATPNNVALDAVTNGTVTWNGTDYTGLDLSAANTEVLKAAALTTHLSSDNTPPTVAYIDGRYVAQFSWKPDANPVFGTATVEDAYRP